MPFLVAAAELLILLKCGHYLLIAMIQVIVIC